MSVGRAIFNTSVTIIFGFSILVLSNFIPTIYFGIFTGLAMLIAMLAVLTLLPKLILLIKTILNNDNYRHRYYRLERAFFFIGINKRIC